MEIKQRDIDGVANSRTSRRYRWHILAWVVTLVIVGLILYYVWGWESVITFSMLGQTYHIPFVAIWFLGLASLALIGCGLWSRAQRSEARALAKEYEGKATLFYSMFFPNRFGQTVGSVVHQRLDARETREIVIAMLVALIGSGTIGGLLSGDTAVFLSARQLGLGALGGLVVWGSLMIVAVLQGKRELAVMREMGYSIGAEGKDRRLPMFMTLMVLACAIIWVVMGIRWLHPFLLLGALGLGLNAISYILFLSYLAPYYKGMKAVRNIKVP